MNEPRYRKATTAEALEVLQSRHGDKFSPAERNELQEAIERLQLIDAQTVPVEPYCLGTLRKLIAKNMSVSEDAKLVEYINSLQSALKRAQEELVKLQEQTQHMIAPINPCSCVADGDNGSVAHLCQWHKNQFGKAHKMQNMADSVTVENFTKLSQDKLRLFIAHGIQESTARKKAESLNKRMVELLRRLSFLAQTTGGTAGRDEELFKVIDESAELLKEVGE